MNKCNAGSQKLNKKLGNTQFLFVFFVILKSVENPVVGKANGSHIVYKSSGDGNLDTEESEQDIDGDDMRKGEE